MILSEFLAKHGGKIINHASNQNFLAIFRIRAEQVGQASEEYLTWETAKLPAKAIEALVEVLEYIDYGGYEKGEELYEVLYEMLDEAVNSEEENEDEGEDEYEDENNGDNPAEHFSRAKEMFAEGKYSKACNDLVCCVESEVPEDLQEKIKELLDEIIKTPGTKKHLSYLDFELNKVLHRIYCSDEHSEFVKDLRTRIGKALIVPDAKPDNNPDLPPNIYLDYFRKGRYLEVGKTCELMWETYRKDKKMVARAKFMRGLISLYKLYTTKLDLKETMAAYFNTAHKKDPEAGYNEKVANLQAQIEELKKQDFDPKNLKTIIKELIAQEVRDVFNGVGIAPLTPAQKQEIVAAGQKSQQFFKPPADNGAKMAPPSPVPRNQQPEVKDEKELSIVEETQKMESTIETECVRVETPADDDTVMTEAKDEKELIAQEVRDVFDGVEIAAAEVKPQQSSEAPSADNDAMMVPPASQNQQTEVKGEQKSITGEKRKEISADSSDISTDVETSASKRQKLENGTQAPVRSNSPRLTP